jgi:hypothetical protein
MENHPETLYRCKPNSRDKNCVFNTFEKNDMIEHADAVHCTYLFSCPDCPLFTSNTCTFSQHRRTKATRKIPNRCPGKLNQIFSCRSCALFTTLDSNELKIHEKKIFICTNLYIVAQFVHIIFTVPLCLLNM